MWRNSGIIIFILIFSPLAVVLSGVVATFGGFLAFYYFFGTYLLGILATGAYIAAAVKSIERLNDEHEVLGTILLILLLLLPTFIFSEFQATSLFQSDTEILFNNAPPEVWAKWALTSLILWPTLCCLVVLLLVLAIGVAVFTFRAILYIAATVVNSKPFSRIISKETQNTITEYRESFLEVADDDAKS